MKRLLKRVIRKPFEGATKPITIPRPRTVPHAPPKPIRVPSKPNPFRPPKPLVVPKPKA